MITAISSFAAGIWLLQQQASLPDLMWLWVPLILIIFLLVPHQEMWKRIVRQILFSVIFCSLGFFYAAVFAQNRLADKLPYEWQGKNIELVGVVAEMPRLHERGLRFAFDVEQVITNEAFVPRKILLSTYENKRDETPILRAGERWQLTVRLKQPHGSSNPHGFDFEAWMLEKNLRATGYVYGKGDNKRVDAMVKSPGYLIEQWRENIRDSFKKTLGDASFAGILIALAIGDQGSITSSQWQVFTRTGVNHLMSISGLHITMLSGAIFALTFFLWRRSARLTLLLPAHKAAAIIGLLAALGYALLAGFAVPAQRTVYMLATIAASQFLSRTIAPSQILAAALLVVLLLDPWAVLSPGFWLSFGAVALIFYVTAHRVRRAHWLVEYGRVQWAMTIGLIPPLLVMFQQVSLVSPIANSFSIPLVSLVVVPLTLLGALFKIEWLLWLAYQALSVCMKFLEWLNTLPDAVWTQHAPQEWTIVLGISGVIWMLLPRGFPARWLGLLMMAPMFLIMPTSPPPGALRLVIFDVGQGLAAAVQTHNHALLYDTGPDFGGSSDSGNRILIPSLRAQGIAQLDGMILTHNDSDHTGGAPSILQNFEVGWVSSSLPSEHALLQTVTNNIRCMDGQSWLWDGVLFEVLHPSEESYRQKSISDNNMGCVIKITIGKHSILLSADIEKESEKRILELHEKSLPATLLVVPHHGSKTSSTQSYVESVRPRYAVFTVGNRNRYGHPNKDVVERYRTAGSELFRSDEDGAILVEMDSNKISINRYRTIHKRYWYQ